MTYEIIIHPHLDRILVKTRKKNLKRFEMVMKKIEEIVENPDHYKNLRAPLQHLKRVHVDSSYVLVFHVDVENRTVTFVDLDHHDNIYL